LDKVELHVGVDVHQEKERSWSSQDAAGQAHADPDCDEDGL
jgi:hypothetical protein